ncbi:hypothetical protein P3X46_010929 [Hevea brasiliensis]|uniref:EGF-like domain-containing protein n=1 Tax=Hevea brasiliensis TaxID=3981 RepID=A0ABQ9MJ54_HEVBR|nr:uncharacterized protein LOC110649992 isoform X2 [Hevea brasiliensis]KAJ9179106.1 hypothetical protein P3X46_010929 [Hevea brasiliensis]
MKKYNFNFSLFSLHILLLTLFARNPAAISQNSMSEDGWCSFVFCGQGTCKNTILGFECECYAGWSKIQIGFLTFLPCLIPNCTIDLQCGNGSPPPPPSAPLPLPPLNLTDPCQLIWCADGSCLPNGTGHICQCNEGSANLLNNTELPCFQECYYGADCNGLGLGPPVPPPPSGSSEVLNSWMSLGVLTMILLAATFLTLF